MTPRIYEVEDYGVPQAYQYIGFFFEGDKPLPMYFNGDCPLKLREEMDAWLVKERAKVGLTAELVEKRKAALAAARAARKAKKEAAA
jgi:hypothetical protein